MRSKLVLLAICLVLGGCSGHDVCANQVVSRLASPGGARQAVLFQRDCGATTAFSTQISVLATGREPAGAGNAFIADVDHGLARTGSWGGPWARMRWTGPARLEVEYASNARVFENKARVGDVEISYRAADR